MKRLAIIGLTFISIHFSMCQNTLNGLDLDRELGKWHDETVGKEHSGLYEGVFYVTKFAPRIGGTHLYYKNSHWSKGNIKFRGQEYKDIDLQYDLYSDVLVVLNRASFPTQSIKLPQSQIENFVLGNSMFRYFQESNAPPLGVGFYEILYEGTKVSLFSKRIKLRDNKGTAVEFRSKAIYYKESDRYFLVVDGEYHLFRNKQKFYKLFKKHKSDLRKFIKSNHLRIKHGNDSDLKQLAQFCNVLESK